MIAKLSHDCRSSLRALVDEESLHVSGDDDLRCFDRFSAIAKYTLDATPKIADVNAPHVGEIIDVTRDGPGNTEIDNKNVAD